MNSHRPACGPVSGPRVAAETWTVVEAKLAETWSPEQISGHFKANGQAGVSHEAIYQRIYADKRRVAPCIEPCVPEDPKKRYGARERRGTIPNQVSIEQRPAIVDCTYPALATGRHQ